MALDRYIQRDLKVIKSNDKLASSLKKLEQVDTLPFIHEGKYLGLINRNNLDQLQKNGDNYEIDQMDLYS